MKRLLTIAALAAVLPWSAGAQVEKQVEVTKAYVPSLESALKLPVAPDMTDTARMRPEIDYSVTPLSLRTTLSTRPIRPATVTYWEFNRPMPFYLKVGAGYPLNSVLDFYAATQHPGTGYIVGYVNHEGRYADIRNDFGMKNNSVRMFNRVGTAAGKYFGRHVLEGDLSYENRLYHRYGAYLADGIPGDGSWAASGAPGAVVDYGDAHVAVRFGDDFQDLRRTNFDILLRGGFFFDHSSMPEYKNKARQTAFDVRAKVARAFGRHRFSLEAGYERLAGQKAIDGYKQHLIHAAARYGIDGGVARLEAGADYYHDKIATAEAENYIIPFLRLDINLGAEGLKPFLELDGSVVDNGFRSLTRRNPYLSYPHPDGGESAGRGWLDKSSVDYNGRLGIGGSLWRDRFTYRVFAGFSIRDNHLYWRGTASEWTSGSDEPAQLVYWPGVFVPEMARQTVTSFNAEVVYRPLTSLRLDLGVHGYLYHDESPLYNGSPSFEGNAGIRYEGRKISFGVEALLQSERKWSLFVSDTGGPGSVFTAPFAVDLRVDFQWKVSGRTALFAEGRNLIDRRLYEFAAYPEYGASFTAGARINF